MTIAKKIAFLQQNHIVEWLETRRKVADEMSDKQSLMCLCGRLATGLHEMNCTKFQRNINEETARRLANLLIKL